MVALTGSATPVTVEPGYVITAPGLVGSAESVTGRAAHTRSGGVESATVALDDALAAGGLREARTIALDVRAQPTAAPPAARTRGTGEDAFVLETPDLGPDRGQVVLAIDEDGVMTWHHPEPTVETAGGVRGGGGSTRFVIRQHVAAPTTSAPAQRGLVQALGRKLLKVLVYPVTDAVFGAVGEHFARRWEEARRPYQLRPFSPSGYDRPSVHALAPEELRRMGGGPALLFIHGTFSTSHGGFGGLPRETVRRLHEHYAGRVFAFDHFTLSDTPERNVDRFLDQLPAGTELQLDVVTHSRGGLVARVLAGALAPVDGVEIRRIVFGATPNRGTALADAAHMTQFLDRVTSLLNLAPPGPLEVVAGALEAVITTVKVVGRAGLKGLDGLAAMDPNGALMARLRSSGRDTGAVGFALAADYEPTGSLAALLTHRVADGVVDRVFAEPNDVVVPTRGVTDAGAPGFPIPGDRCVSFPPRLGVWHSSLFGQQAASEALLTWLADGP